MYNPLIKVTLNEWLQTIEREAFYRQRNNLDITITEIQEGTFDSNQIAILNLESAVSHKEENAFFRNKIREIQIPSQVENIGTSAFSGTRIDKITIPASGTSIGDDAFSDTNIADLTIPNATEIGDDILENTGFSAEIILLSAWMDTQNCSFE